MTDIVANGTAPPDGDVLGYPFGVPAPRTERPGPDPEPAAFPIAPAVIPAARPDSEPDEDADRESVLVTAGGPAGPPVDPPDEPRPFAPVSGQRAPIVPPWLATRAAARDSALWTAGEAWYHLRFHGLRSPKYAGKTVVYAPAGLYRLITRLLHWASAEEGNWHLRQHAASRADSATWLALDLRRQRQSAWRWWVVGAVAVAVTAATVVVASGLVPPLWRLVILAGLLPVLARAGRPADKPITDRVSAAGTYRKLTAELVRRALLSAGLNGITSAVAKDPGAISFPEEIHKDGPGYLAIVDLPHGVEAADVIARRGKLASGLRLPLDQVWPEPGTGHTGRLNLWVGHEPASKMRQPAWPLLKTGTGDVFKPFPFATTPRLDTVSASLMFRNWLFGGQPGSGKSFAMRLAVLAAALDPRAEIHGYELGGKGDFKPLAPVCAEYGNGNDDDTLAACAAMFDWLYKEGQRRSGRIDYYASIGKAPENKVTPELAALLGSGLHPLVVFVDEAQELFLFGKTGKAAGEMAERCIKLYRAMGIILIIGTQIPDKDSLPTGITRNINTRFCLSVADQVANDMILGTSAYKLGYRATVFEPEVEAGWGILAGLGKPGARRSFYVDGAAAASVMARAIAARTRAGTMPDPEAQAAPAAAGYDVLADVAAAWPGTEDAAWNETLLERLAAARPEVYGRWEPAQLTAALANHDISTGQIGRRIDGKTVNRRGPARADIQSAITLRNQNRGR